ncbi:MAG: 1,4-alpha-glucan branching protein GlgB [Miltoncostaeaceae bacterium]
MSGSDVVNAIANCTLPDPHGVLGAHPLPDGTHMVHACVPGARRIEVIAGDGTPTALAPLHDAGIFGGRVGGLTPPNYWLRITPAQGSAVDIRDPYAFLPTLGDLDLHLTSEGRHGALWTRLGANAREVDGVAGVGFAVWAPNARSVSVVGDFNGWDGRVHQMRSLGQSGIWEIFVPGATPGDRYKFEIRCVDGHSRARADPLARQVEPMPGTASVVDVSHYAWGDAAWMQARAVRTPYAEPMSTYEVHLPSWRRNDLEGNRSLTYLELADDLTAYVVEMGFTHVELMPVMAHPFPGSWGYQVTSYFAPLPSQGSPDDLRLLIDTLHRSGIGVILDWVPAHFPRDDWALALFDGTPLYEHDDPRMGAHPDWGTLIFNFGRHEVRNFLIASARYWLEEFHVDGLRVDAVASMLYLDYSREPGEWVPNAVGGRENLDAMRFLSELNEDCHRESPGVAMIAEESTAWPGVSRPTASGGLGFGFKWNLGWMHDVLAFLARDPIHRRHHHREITFSLLYAFTEHFVLPLSHDEVVHGKGSLISRMPGDRWQQFAGLRALYAYMWAHPGKKLLFMGGEFAQDAEWGHDRSLDWHLLAHGHHEGVRQVVRDLNHLYRAHPALWCADSRPEGFVWLEPDDAGAGVLAFSRVDPDGDDIVVCVLNLTPVPRHGYRVGLPAPGHWREALNTDSRHYGGSDCGNMGGVDADDQSWHRQQWSAEVTVPPLGVVWLVPESST